MLLLKSLNWTKCLFPQHMTRPGLPVIVGPGPPAYMSLNKNQKAKNRPDRNSVTSEIAINWVAIIRALALIKASNK